MYYMLNVYTTVGISEYNIVNDICFAKFTIVFLCHNFILYDNSNDALTTPSYCNDTHIIAGMYLVYIHFSDFSESYKPLLMHGYKSAY